MQHQERIKHLFGASIESQIAVADVLPQEIVNAGMRLADCLLKDGKILVCGNGGSAANCLHFSAAMLNHFEVERPPLPVIVLGTDVSVLTTASSEGYAEFAFARQIQALGHENDVLLVLSTSGNANSLLHAVAAAKDRNIDVVVLSGRDGGVLANRLGPDDLELRVPVESAARIRETHLFIIHCFCDLIEQTLFVST